IRSPAGGTWQYDCLRTVSQRVARGGTVGNIRRGTGPDSEHVQAATLVRAPPRATNAGSSPMNRSTPTLGRAGSNGIQIETSGRRGFRPFRGLGVTLLVVAPAVAPAAAQEGARPAAPAAAETMPALPESWISAFQWRNIGPANTGGRIAAIAVNEKDPNMW